VWLPSEDDVVWEYIPGTPCWNWYSGGGLDYPTSVAVEASGNVWVPNSGNASVSAWSPSGDAWLAASGYTGAGESDPDCIAIDASGNAWIGNWLGETLSEYSSSGVVLSTSSGYSGGGIGRAEGVAIDGAGNVWAASSGGGGSPIDISEFSSTGVAISGSNGYAGANLGGPNAIAVDGSGNVWVTDPNSYNYIDEFVGLAAPVVTPLAANLTAPYGSHAVNLP
jgi:sugar lactone lactonase YvrE